MRQSLQKIVICNVHYTHFRFWQHQVQTDKFYFFLIDPQTKKKIIAENSSTAHGTIEEAFKDSLKRLFLKG